MPTTKPYVIYGEGGYDTTKPNNNVIETGTLVVSDEDTNRATILQQAEGAIGTIATHRAVANGSMTLALVVTQLRFLQAVVSKLIRVMINRYEATD